MPVWHEGSVEIIEAIKLAGLEQTVTKDDLTALGTAARSTTAIMLLIDMLDREAVTLSDHVRDSIAPTLDEMAEILEKGGYPIDISLRYSALLRCHSRHLPRNSR